MEGHAARDTAAAAATLLRNEGLVALARPEYHDAMFETVPADAQLWLFRLPGGLRAKDLVDAHVNTDGAAVAGSFERTETQPVTGHRRRVAYALTHEGDTSEMKQFVALAGNEQLRVFKAPLPISRQVNVVRVMAEPELPAMEPSETATDPAALKHPPNMTYYFHPIGAVLDDGTTSDSTHAESSTPKKSKKKAKSVDRMGAGGHGQTETETKPKATLAPTPGKTPSRKKHAEAAAVDEDSSSSPTPRKHKKGKIAQ